VFFVVRFLSSIIAKLYCFLKLLGLSPIGQKRKKRKTTGNDVILTKLVRQIDEKAHFLWVKRIHRYYAKRVVFLAASIYNQRELILEKTSEN